MPSQPGQVHDINSCSHLIAEPHPLNQTGSARYRLGRGVHSIVWRTRRASSTAFDVYIQDKEATNAQPEPLEELSIWQAVKVVYDNDTMPPHDIVREAAILKDLSHRNIVSILGFVRGGPDAPYALYMPLIPLPLTALLSSPLFTPNPITGPYSAFSRPVLASSQQVATEPFIWVAKSLIYQLLLSISYLHSLNPPVAHRDINPGNVLIDSEGTVKLIDFGIAWIEPQYGSVSEATMGPESLSADLSQKWRETSEAMCCQVATGPHRPPELLFSPTSYSALAVDRWCLGTTIAQFFTPLQLIPSNMLSSATTTTPDDDVDEVISSPFVISTSLQKDIDYWATWERKTLFDGEQGELGLAWSIFQLRGTPNDKTWPSFSSLPAASKIEFCDASPIPLSSVLPHLPTSPADVLTSASLVSMIDAFLAYPPLSRLSAAQALQHPWFALDLLLPTSHPGPNNTVHGSKKTWVTELQGKTIAQWLEPALIRETTKVTFTER